ncbi:MAG: hypothetical protein LIP77_07405 [Planctomycetes bacterium]|nr:hypothetical protein [Planctomycetota bacterium]
MKHCYINSRLKPLLLQAEPDVPAKNWLFSAGEPWLLLTPNRLGRLAERLGTDDRRIRRLLGNIRRHGVAPEEFCRRLGLEESGQIPEDEYPLVTCPACNGLHSPHPEESRRVCPECRRREAAIRSRLPAGGEVRDRRHDAMARNRLREILPGDFDGDHLSPNYRINQSRRLARNWDQAINRILMGNSYRKVASEFHCSVGLLHRKVQEVKHWQNN